MAISPDVIDRTAHFTYLLRLGDNALVLGHRMSEWCGRAPFLEEELALANIGLDLIGQARSLLDHAGQVEGKGRDGDKLAFLRDAADFTNVLLVEQPNGDFAASMVRQLFYALFAEAHWQALKASSDETLAGIAAKAEKEAAYHVRHASEWVIRLGDGTAESHARTQAALDDLIPFTGELFEMDGVDRAAIAVGIGVDAGALKAGWSEAVDAVLAEATLRRPREGWMQSGGRKGQHTEHLGHMLSQMQFLQRAYPGGRW